MANKKLLKDFGKKPKTKFNIKNVISGFSVLVIIAAFAVFAFTFKAEKKPYQAQEIELGFPFGPSDTDSLVRRIDKLLAKNKIDLSGLEDLKYPILTVFRSNGSQINSSWHEDINWKTALASSMQNAKKSLKKEQFFLIDTIELEITHSYSEHAPLHSRRLDNVHRGIYGIELSFNNTVERVTPTSMISQNRDFKKIIQLFIQRHQIPANKMREISLRTFESDHFLIKGDKITKTFRGNIIVKPKDVSKTSTIVLIDGMSTWMKNNLYPNGKMTYKYWPSSGVESGANNMIRQFMATISLFRLAAYYDDEELLKRAQQNLDYNLKAFYKTENGLGFIEFNGKVKLGACGLAGLAIFEDPDRARNQDKLDALLKMIDHLWQKDGSFRTFYRPASMDGSNQNFYAGEALLLLASLYAENNDQKLKDKIMQSYKYYKIWHLENRNPAFIPWQTQAFFIMWEQTKDENLKNWIFEMNDWLLDVQQWDGLKFEDTKGRFYDPTRPFGPPHASATGVYLEGLIDAFRLAREVGDKERTEQYRLSIARAIRSLMQLQFTDEIDMFYISRKTKALGGLRTTVYNNEIRVDNIQHGMMGLLKTTEEFEETDYKLVNN